VLAQQRGGREEEREEEEEEEEVYESTSRDNFVQDPALLRALAEQRRATKFGQNYTPPPSRDVVGEFNIILIEKCTTKLSLFKLPHMC
jgi:hypothetical protein